MENAMIITDIVGTILTVIAIILKDGAIKNEDTKKLLLARRIGTIGFLAFSVLGILVIVGWAQIFLEVGRMA